MEENRKDLLCEVLASAASQMRGPLGNLHAALRQLQAQDLPAGSGEERNAAIAVQSYYRLLRIVGNLSDAPLLSGAAIIRGADADVVSWLEDLIRQAQPLAREQGLTLCFHCTEKYHRMSLHRGLMEKLVWNLLSNAMKFTPAGGRIDVSLEFRGGQALLSVADNGCGISAGQMETVYERYLHPEKIDPPPHGLGLGLPLCRRIAEGHGGRLMLTSREGEGTTATVSLPDEESGGAAVEEPMLLDDGGFQRVLVGLSDALRWGAFTRKHLDE